MNTKSIELELLYENAYGKIYINKNYHIIDVETEEPEEFFDSLAKATEILGEEYICNKSFENDFIYTQTAATAVQTCTVIHEHKIPWDPMMAAMQLMAKEVGVNMNNPAEAIPFMLRTIGNL